MSDLIALITALTNLLAAATPCLVAATPITLLLIMRHRNHDTDNSHRIRLQCDLSNTAGTPPLSEPANIHTDPTAPSPSADRAVNG